jgi:hypothetical protein
VVVKKKPIRTSATRSTNARLLNIQRSLQRGEIL